MAQKANAADKCCMGSWKFQLWIKMAKLTDECGSVIIEFLTNILPIIDQPSFFLYTHTHIYIYIYIYRSIK